MPWTHAWIHAWTSGLSFFTIFQFEISEISRIPQFPTIPPLWNSVFYGNSGRTRSFSTHAKSKIIHQKVNSFQTCFWFSRICLCVHTSGFSHFLFSNFQFSKFPRIHNSNLFLGMHCDKLFFGPPESHNFKIPQLQNSKIPQNGILYFVIDIGDHLTQNPFMFSGRYWSHIHGFGDLISRIFMIFRCPSFPKWTSHLKSRYVEMIFV